MSFEPSASEVRARPFLFLVLEADRPLAGGGRFALESLDEILIGRAETGAGRQSARSTTGGRRRLTIRSDGQFLSKDHAMLRRGDGNAWTVEDLGSRNGV